MMRPSQVRSKVGRASRVSSCAVSLVLACVLQAQADIARFSPYDQDRDISVAELSSSVEAARKGGTLREGLLGGFNSLDMMAFPGVFPQRLRLVHDSLFVASQSEPNALYGLLAQSVEVSPDLSEATIVLNEDARWHDGTAVTAWDVKFTFETVLANSSPNLRNSLGGLSVSVHDSKSLTINTQSKHEWLWLEIAGTYPIQSQEHWSTRDPSSSTMEPPLGSAPYKAARVDAGRQLRLERANDYWAAEHPLNLNRWNFDVVVSEYFQDPITRTEAMLAGQLDVIRETDPSRWENAYGQAALERGGNVRTALNDPNLVSVPSLFFNLRRPLFEDQRVRQAIALAVDVGFLLDLSGSVFEPTQSYFGSLPWAAEAVPEAHEAMLLEPFSEQLPEGFLTSAPPAAYSTAASKRQRRAQAASLFEAAGFVVRDGVLVDQETSAPVEIELLVSDRTAARRLLPLVEWMAELGITLEILTPDPSVVSQIRATHQFNMLYMNLGHSGLPGFIENFFWHSRFKDTGFSVSGLESEVADALVDTMQVSRDIAEIENASRAFDRYLQWARLFIPLWQQDEAWFVHSEGLVPPKTDAADVSPAAVWYWE